MIPTFHPAAVLRGGGETSRQFQDLRDDFRLMRATLDEATAPAPPPEPAPGTDAPPADVDDGQLGLF